MLSKSGPVAKRSTSRRKSEKRRYDISSRAASATQTRERILMAALQLFRDQHYDDVTFVRIAEAAGVSPQTIVLHFRTKEGLIEALEAWWRPQERALRAVDDGDPLEAARRICARYEDTGLMMLRLQAIEERVPVIGRLLGRARKMHAAWVEETFARKLPRGEARKRRIATLIAAYDVLTWHVLRQHLGPEETVTAVAELAAGLLAKKGT